MEMMVEEAKRIKQNSNPLQSNGKTKKQLINENNEKKK
jgi:hypothetical protein